MAPPVVFTPPPPTSATSAAAAAAAESPDPFHLFVADGSMWYLPLYRMGGLYAPANGEFSTPQMMLTENDVKELWINVDATWGQSKKHKKINLLTQNVLSRTLMGCSDTPL